MPCRITLRTSSAAALSAGVIVLAVAALPALAEGDRATVASPPRISVPATSTASPKPAPKANLPAARRDQRSIKPPPQHRRDYGYSGFAGKDF